jgi:DNA-binding MarR family transcriptional regulator
MARRRRRQITLEDPRAIRALSHPARIMVIDELYGGRVATSTELAELTGLSPSAMSYHMRAMEKLGIIEREPSATDARERPWRAAGAGITFAALTTRAQHAAASQFADVLMDTLQKELAAYVTGKPALPAQWREKGGLITGTEYLTADETKALIDALDAALEPYRRKGRRRRKGTRRVRVSFLVVPIVD